MRSLSISRCRKNRSNKKNVFLSAVQLCARVTALDTETVQESNQQQKDDAKDQTLN